MRSEVYRFTEFRTSLCVSQFAASFIDTRAKASTAARDSYMEGTMTYNRMNGKNGSEGHTRRHNEHWTTSALANDMWTLIRANDPSAGSPTETLLRLLLPLSDKVH
jgi:hypothetical protein